MIKHFTALPGYNYLTAIPIPATYPQNSMQSQQGAVLTRFIGQPARLELPGSTTPMLQCSEQLALQQPSIQLTQHKSSPSSASSSIQEASTFPQTANHSLLTLREMHQGNNFDLG